MDKKRYSRKITEILPQSRKGLKKIFLLKSLEMFSLMLLLCLFAVFSYVVVNLYQKNENSVNKRVEAKNKLVYWKEMTKKYPNYAKTYYMAAVYSMDFGEKPQAIKYLNKAIEVDPDFVEAKKFKTVISR